MSRSGANLALQLLGGFRSLSDAASIELARRGFEDLRPAHEFAMRAIAAGASNASELGRRLAVSKQAAAKTIAVLERRGYVAREETAGARRKCLCVTTLGLEALRQGEAIFDDLRNRWRRKIGSANLKKLEALLTTLVGPVPVRLDAPGWIAHDPADPR